MEHAISPDWLHWLTNPANLTAVLTPALAFGAVVVWGIRLHLQTLRRFSELRTQVSVLTVAKDAAETASAAKDDFLARLSHELRTPLNGITRFAECALNTELPIEQRHALDTVLYSAEWLTHVVSDVLDFTHMQSVPIQLENEPFSVSEIAHAAIDILEPRARQKNLTISYKVDPRVPPTCIGDRNRLRQVLVNLLENAIRHTSCGSVMLAIRPEQDDNLGADVVLNIAVADTGTGIPIERHGAIFEPFQGGPHHGNQHHSGAGLGLSICRHLVNLMGGTIEVQSQIGAGSTFRFTAHVRKPIEAEAPDSHAESASRSARRLSVLLAQADANSRRTNTKLLESAGHQVTPAASAAEAVDAFSTELFDLVLMDGEMSDNDSVRPCEQMHGFETDSAPTPIYLFVSGGQPAEPGVDGYLSKPIDSDELLALVRQVAAPVNNAPDRSPSKVTARS